MRWSLSYDGEQQSDKVKGNLTHQTPHEMGEWCGSIIFWTHKVPSAVEERPWRVLRRPVAAGMTRLFSTLA
jgi:hypothetical protein